jgi:hypothetical protein
MFPNGPDLLANRLLEAGISLAPERAEEDAVVERWLRADLNAGSVGADVLARAAALGRSIYREFMAAFHAAFLSPDGYGVRQVRRLLRRRFGQSNDLAEDAALNRIRDLRLKLLDHLRSRTQPSLLTEQRFTPGRLAGYMRNVARIESLKLDEADLPWKREPFRERNRLHRGPLPVDDDEAIDYPVLAERLSRFWCEANGFRDEHRLEGLVSLGLGHLSGDATIAARCGEWLQQRLPAWEEQEARLRQRASRLLERRQVLQDSLCETPKLREAIEEDIATVEALLTGCRLSLARHPARLRPKAKVVKNILLGRVQRVGAVRHARINREVALLRRRVCEGERGLNGGCVLLKAILVHLDREPPSPRQHGLSSQARAERQAQHQNWLEEAGRLLCVARTIRAQERETTLGDWAADVEDLYEFGILCRKGVLEGLGRRHGSRLARLLRVGGRPLDQGPCTAI